MAGSSPALLILGVPHSFLCGIDLLSFTSSPKFSGLRDIPPGYHFFFLSQTASHTLRDGFWFYIPPSASSSESTLLVRKWDPDQHVLLSVEDPGSYRSYAIEAWATGLSPYRQSAEKEAIGPGDWANLTQHINPALLTHLTQNRDWALTSASCAPIDVEVIPGIDDEEAGFKDRELGVLGIDLKKTWPENAVGRARTTAALDKSWALEDIVNRWQADGDEWGDIVLGQMEACFLMVLTLANYSCMEEWKRCLGLGLACETAVNEHPAFFVKLLVLLNKQISRCEDIDGGLFDMSDGGGVLSQWLRTFRRSLGRLSTSEDKKDVSDELLDLETNLKDRYGLDLTSDIVTKGKLELEDGETVDMDTNENDGEDEEGEYAPVVVELENG